MRDALKKAYLAAVTHFAMRAESLALVRARDVLLVLEPLWWPDEARSAPARPDTGGKCCELKAMTDLFEAMAADFDPEQFHNHYREALHEVIKVKAAGLEVKHVERPAPEAGEKVGNLLAAL